MIDALPGFDRSTPAKCQYDDFVVEFVIVTPVNRDGPRPFPKPI